jgi:hypothetical protein
LSEAIRLDGNSQVGFPKTQHAKLMNNLTPYEQFCWSVFDDSMGAQRDGVDVQALADLTSEQKAEVGQRLLEVLVQTNDSRPFIAAGAMKLRAAAPIIKQRLATGFKKSSDYMSVHSAHALFLIEQWPDALAIILDVFKNTPKGNQWTRMMAVEALADFQNDKLSLKALFDAVEDEDDFIGFLAIQSLKNVFAHDDQIAPLLNRLEKTQIEPNRWIPNFLNERQKLFTALQNLVVIEMPKVAKQKKMVSESIKPDMKQIPLFRARDAG